MPVQLPQQELSSGIRHNLLLAFKEALNNAAKYAQASEVRIALTADDDGLELVVADNGKGFVMDEKRAGASGLATDRPVPGKGLGNLRSRLQEIGGNCDLTSHPGQGTTITFRVKLNNSHGQG
jgi:signal transduction histidine kinase